MKTIRLSAKCSDLFDASLAERVGDQNVLRGEYHGYVPSWFPNPKEEHYGDYVQLDIDVETGRILNWKKPSQANLKETFEKS